MKKNSPLFLLFPLLAFAISTNADVKEQCKTITAGNVPPNPNYYDFCVTSLQVVPGSNTADTATLTVMTARLTVANATTNKIKIKTLIQQETNSTVKSALKVCKENYSSVVDNVRDAVDYLKSKDYTGANEMVGAGISDASTCDDGFTDMGLQSPVAKETNDLHSLLAVLIRFVTQLGKQKV